MKGVAFDKELKRQRRKETLRQKFLYRIGEVHGNLKIIDIVIGERRTLCRCECLRCGNIIDRPYYDLTSGKVTSCGCYHSEMVSKYASTNAPTNRYGYNWYFNFNDTITYCDSSYEVIYANYLIRNNINFEYHTKILKLSDGCRYIPDFYLIDEDTFVEIKAKHWAKENLYKSIECKDMNYKIIILDYNELRELDNIPYVCSSGILRAARKSGIKEEDYLAQSLYLKQLKR